MLGVILITGILSLIAGYWIRRVLADKRRAYWILGRAFTGIGILALGYGFCWLPGIAALYYLGLLP